jgi:hypothetical protein
MTEEICRVLKVEKADGSYYIAQRKVYPHFFQRMFGYREPYWVCFSLRQSDKFKDWSYEEDYAFDYEDYDTVPKDRFELFKDIKVAEYYCSEYIRRNTSGVVVKTWSIEE